MKIKYDAFLSLFIALIQRIYWIISIENVTYDMVHYIIIELYNNMPFLIFY